MKTIAIQIAIIAVVTLAVGTAFNASRDNYLEFAPSNSDVRYPNALTCFRVEAAKPKSPAPSKPGPVASTKGSVTKPAGTPATTPTPPTSGTPKTSAPESTAGAPAGTASESTTESTTESTQESGGAESATAVAPTPDGIPHILHAEAHEMWESGFLFVDARRTKPYEDGHIPGAVSISAWEPGIGAKISELLESEVLEAPVVVYCTRAKDCEDSHIVGSNLKSAGFQVVYVYQGGFPDWKDNGREVATGSEPGRRPE